MKKDWTDQIRKLANENQRPLPEHIWEELIPHLPQPKNRKPIAFFYFAMLSIAILFFLLLGWRFIAHDQEQNSTTNTTLAIKAETTAEKNDGAATGAETSLKETESQTTGQQSADKLTGASKSQGLKKVIHRNIITLQADNIKTILQENIDPSIAATEADRMQQLQHFENILFLPAKLGTIRGIGTREIPIPEWNFRNPGKSDCFDFRKSKKNYFSLDIYAGPSYNPYSLKDQRGDLNTYIQKRQETEEVKLGFLAGIRAGYHISNYAILAGLEYQQFYEQLNYRNLEETKIVMVYKDSVLLYSDTIRGERIVKTHNYHRLFNIPLSLSYTFKWKSFNISILPGIGLNLSASHKGKILDLTNQPADFSSNVANSNFNIYDTQVGTYAFLNFQFAQKLNQKFDWFVEPGFTHFFKPFNKANYPADQSYQSVQIKLGIRLKM